MKDVPGSCSRAKCRRPRQEPWDLCAECREKKRAYHEWLRNRQAIDKLGTPKVVEHGAVVLDYVRLAPRARDVFSPEELEERLLRIQERVFREMPRGEFTQETALDESGVGLREPARKPGGKFGHCPSKVRVRASAKLLADQTLEAVAGLDGWVRTREVAAALGRDSGGGRARVARALTKLAGMGLVAGEVRLERRAGGRWSGHNQHIWYWKYLKGVGGGQEQAGGPGEGTPGQVEGQATPKFGS